MSTSAAGLTPPTKPPNVILIDAVKSTESLERMRSSLATCLDPEQYAIHQLPLEDVSTKPWKTNAVGVMLTNCENLTRNHWLEMYAFYRDGGIVILFCTKLLRSLDLPSACVFFPEDEDERRALFASLERASDQECLRGVNQNAETFIVSWDVAHPNPATIFYAVEKQASGAVAFANFHECTSGEHSVQYFRSLLTKVGLSVRSDAYRIPSYTPGRLFIDQDSLDNIESRYLGVDTLVGNKLTTQFLRDLDSAKPAASDYLPVSVGGGGNASFTESGDHLSPMGTVERAATDKMEKSFNSELYFRHLKTSTMGKAVLYVPVISSTMDVFDGSICDTDLLNRMVVVAGVQREGRGRGDNKWISPSGCIAYSYFISRPTSSVLMKYCSWLQHLAVLSLVDSIRKREPYAETPLQVKWPNDIYTSDKVKIGGVLVHSSLSSVSCNFVVGCGLNLSNEKPTVSLNSIIPKGTPPLRAEEVIALSMSSMEKFVRMIEEQRTDELRALYRKYWLHGGQKVTMAETGESVEVIDLDKHGYLLVHSEETGETFSLQPDGNSFDMMDNMIRSRT